MPRQTQAEKQAILTAICIETIQILRATLDIYCPDSAIAQKRLSELEQIAYATVDARTIDATVRAEEELSSVDNGSPVHPGV